MYVGKDADCFWDVGAYQVCDATQYISIYSSMFLLMTQALVSRIFGPGKSNFVNASVRRSLLGFRVLLLGRMTRVSGFAQRVRVEPKRG